jgi:hypothetical protein
LDGEGNGLDRWLITKTTIRRRTAWEYFVVVNTQRLIPLEATGDKTYSP